MNFKIEYQEGELFIGTNELANKFDVEHRSLKRTVLNNWDDIVDVGDCVPKTRNSENSYANLIRKSPVNTKSVFGSLISRKSKSKKAIIGRPTKEYLLNEQQATFVVILLRGKNKTDHCSIIKFKKHLTKCFFKQRKMLATLLLQKSNADWLEKRASGKIERKIETDTIKDFVEYATKQGSKNAKKYYMAISKMQNTCLFSFDYITQKFPNIRNIAQGFQLDSLKMADRIVNKAIKEGMEEGMGYKDIYTKSKANVEQFVSILGQTPIQIAFQNH